jgi:hypothetical protein
MATTYNPRRALPQPWYRLLALRLAVAKALRQQRQKSGLSRFEAAKELDLPIWKVYTMEVALTRVPLFLIHSALDLYGATPSTVLSFCLGCPGETLKMVTEKALDSRKRALTILGAKSDPFKPGDLNG